MCTSKMRIVETMHAPRGGGKIWGVEELPLWGENLEIAPVPA